MIDLFATVATIFIGGLIAGLCTLVPADRMDKPFAEDHDDTDWWLDI